MDIMITGGNGFSGQALAKFLPEKLLLGRAKKLSTEQDHKNYICCDLLDPKAINEVIEAKQPKQIFHLAGSFTNSYEKDFEANVTATKNLLEAVKVFSISSRVLLVGSAAEYGLISSENCPVSETTPLNPCNVYGLTKIYQKYMMDYYANSSSLDLVMARPFNLYGKGISSRLFIGKVYEEIEKVKAGESNNISLGNLNSERDYISIEEAVKHYIKIMECGKSGEVYNVGRGVSTATADILKSILQEENVDVSLVKSGERPPQANDSDKIYANISKLRGIYND